MTAFVTLYIVNFLRTIAIIAILYYGIRFLARYLFPILIDKGIKNMQQKMQDQQPGSQKPRRSEGEVTIEGNPGKQNSQGRKGEYVDFEEVE